MPQNITDDWYDFRRIIGGKQREELKKHITHGSIFRQRGKNGKISIPIPKINIPNIVYGDNGEGTGAGVDGNEGDVIQKGDPKGKGKGKPGTDPGEGMNIGVELDEILKLLKDELHLPEMKPKPNQTYEEIRTVYNGIAKTGPNALLHKPRTMKQCMKRFSSMGLLGEDKKKLLPGFNTPVTVMTPISDDRRYRQHNEIKIPSSNAVIFFLRDGSGSMGQEKCDIASDIAWWIKLYIQHFYKKTEIVYIWHDTEAKEMSENDFFGVRNGGGTYASSSTKMMEKIIEERYPPIKWNIYGLYFGDGETYGEDNKKFSESLATKLGPDVVNMFGQVEIFGSMGTNGLKGHLDKEAKGGRIPHLRNSEIKSSTPDGGWGGGGLTGEQRDLEVKRIISELLGKDAKQASENIVQENTTAL
jgi:uncharacterized sporulation protein YeaH/YhbH (DUF444 family)